VTILAYGDETYPGYAGKFLPFSTLFEEDENGELRGKLARSWEQGPEPGTWLLHLRSGVRWHDGEPFTAHDVEFSINYHASRYETLPGACTADVLDDTTLVAGNDGRCGIWPFDTWSEMLPRHLLADLASDDERMREFRLRPVGTGPYRWVRYVPKTMIEYEANPDYFLGEPGIDRVILKFGSDVQMVELLAGNVDAVGTWGGIALEDLPKLGETFQTYWKWLPGRRTVIVWNHGNELFADVRVRRALTLAIDRPELAEVRNYPAGVPTPDVPLTSGLYRRGGYPEPLPYDPDLAGELLGELGWTDTDGDEVRDRNGQPFRFTALVSKDASAEAVLVQEQLRRVGVRMEIQPIDYVLTYGRMSNGEFDAAFLMDAISLERGLWVTDEDSQPWKWGYYNPRFAGLLGEWRQSEYQDPVRSDSLFLEITRIFREDQPLTYLLPDLLYSVVHRRIQGLSSPYRHDPVPAMEYLWIDEDWADGDAER
jgi:peptide/nickel transport system substrate-binding protein